MTVDWGFPADLLAEEPVRFDRAVRSPSGRFHVLYAERGAEALLLDHGKPLRELTRGPSMTSAFDYPVALGRLPGGREILVHCPVFNNRLDVEDAATGELLTPGERKPPDVFHSRLEVSPDGRHLLSAGWVWQPYGECEVFDLTAALEDAAVLDRYTGFPPMPDDGEIDAACWLDSDRFVLTSFHDVADPPRTRTIAVWSVATGACVSESSMTHPAGRLIARGEQVVSLHGHPRLIDPATGTVLAEWPDVPVSTRVGCYGRRHVPSAVATLHPDGRRLAVAVPDGVTVLDLDAG